MNSRIGLLIILFLVFTECKETKRPMILGLDAIRLVEKKPFIADSYSNINFTIKLYNYDTNFNLEKDISDTAYVEFIDNDTVLTSGKLIMHSNYYNLNKSREDTFEAGDSIRLEYFFTESESISLIGEAAVWYKRNKGYNGIKSGAYFKEFINYAVKKQVKLYLTVKNKKIILTNGNFVKV